MLRKLFRHEIRSLSRYFIPMYIIVLLLSPLIGLMVRFNQAGITARSVTLSSGAGQALASLVPTFSMVGYILLLTGITVASSVLILIRFYRTTATTEAYLTFTVPASTGQILWSKLLASVLWEVLSGLVIVLSLFILMLTAIPFDSTRQFFSGLGFLIRNADSSIWLTFAIVLLAIILSLFSGALQFFCAIALGQLFNDHRLLISIGFYAAIYFVLQIITAIAIMPVSILTAQRTVDDTLTATLSGVNITMGISCILAVAYSVAFFCVIRFIWKKHLNVK